MIGLEGKTLRSRHLNYRLLEEKDRQALRIILRDAAVTAPAGFLPAKTDEEFERFFHLLTKQNTAVAVRLGETLIGYFHVGRAIMLPTEYYDKLCANMGFVLGAEWHGKGYGTEMLETMTEYMLTRCDCCFADHFEENIASRRVIEKCGYRYVEKYQMEFEEIHAVKTCLSYVRE